LRCAEIVRAKTGVGTFLAVGAVAWSVIRCGAPGGEPIAVAGNDGGGIVEPGNGGLDGGNGNSGHDAPDAGVASDAGAKVDGGPGRRDAAADASADASGCAVPCSGATPVCDEGTCKTCTDTAGCSADAPVCDTSADGGLGQCIQVRVVAIQLPDAQMTDRAHAAYQRDANTWFPQAAMEHKFFTYEDSNDWDQLKTIKPAKGLIIMFLDTSPSDAAQQAGFKSYMESGGAWFGCHFSAYNDTSAQWSWRWYFDDFLGGGLFVMNTWEPVSVKLDVEIPTHPVSQGLGSMFTSAPSEWYSWTNDLRTKPNIQILLSVDPSSFPVGTDPNQSWYSGYYPIAWTNTNYKMMYVNMGHDLMDYSTDTEQSNTFTSPTQNIMYLNAFKWLGGAQQ
jgi:hypothetical protein